LTKKNGEWIRKIDEKNANKKKNANRSIEPIRPCLGTETKVCRLQQIEKV